jgi:hypothetical protein
LEEQFLQLIELLLPEGIYIDDDIEQQLQPNRLLKMARTSAQMKAQHPGN